MLHISFSHITGFSLEAVSRSVCMHVCIFTNVLSILLHAHYFVCATKEKSCVCSSASKVYLLSCLQRYISVCMNACVIVRACFFLWARLLSAAACLLGSAVTWPLLRNTRGSSSAVDNYRISHSYNVLGFTCTWETLYQWELGYRFSVKVRFCFLVVSKVIAAIN